jgi:hypothetical protein
MARPDSRLLHLAGDHVGNPRSTDAGASGIQEQGSGGAAVWSLVEPGTKGLYCAVPEGTGAVFAAFTAQCDHWDGIKSKVADVEVNDLLHARAGVVKEEKQSTIASVICRDGPDQRDDLGVVEIPDLGALEACR